MTVALTLMENYLPSYNPLKHPFYHVDPTSCFNHIFESLHMNIGEVIVSIEIL